MKKHKLFVIFQILLYSCSGTEDTGFTFTAESFDETYCRLTPYQTTTK